MSLARATVVLVILALVPVGCDDAELPAASPTPGGRGEVWPVAADAAAVLLDGTGRDDPGVPLGVESFEIDPDAWVDVIAYAERVVEPLAERLLEAHPGDADRMAIETNRATYLTDLAALDAYARRVVALVPESGRRLETSHAELEAFGDAYALDVVIVDQPTELDGELLIGRDAPASTFEATYLGRADHNITAIARHLGAPGVDVHGSTGRLTLGHDHDAEHENHADDHVDHG